MDENVMQSCIGNCPVVVELMASKCGDSTIQYSSSFLHYLIDSMEDSYQSSSLIAAINCDVAFFCAVSACRFVRVGRIWVYDLQSSKVGEEGKKKEDQAIKAGID
ncbi:hypothetical protein T03_15020 [Trichinella britovi]|uniref:Uncharacterized protein n=1 Tax=Trichinella britovi TaxID=45882 RepID=A0A0V1C579_TRIBR|nr:hypothetical protein T03_15020 [Trichinella britovi]